MSLLRGTLQRLFDSTTKSSLALNNGINLFQVRTKIRYLLAHPSETKRVRKNGYLKMTKTLSGRKVLMTKILRGDKVIAQ